MLGQSPRKKQTFKRRGATRWYSSGQSDGKGKKEGSWWDAANPAEKTFLPFSSYRLRVTKHVLSTEGGGVEGNVSWKLEFH